eukprot:Stramenopile-MAST_4_protein_6756
MASDRTGFRMVCFQRNVAGAALAQLPHVPGIRSVHAFGLREVAGGIFTMGTNDDAAQVVAKPSHHVHVDKFWASATEVTRGEFEAFVSQTQYVPDSVSRGCLVTSESNSAVPFAGRNYTHPGFDQTDNHPVVCVTWTDAMAFATWVDQQVGNMWNCTLPTEAQWEKAAKGTARGVADCDETWYDRKA